MLTGSLARPGLPVEPDEEEAQYMVRGLSLAAGEEDHRRVLEAAEVRPVHLLGAVVARLPSQILIRHRDAPHQSAGH